MFHKIFKILKGWTSPQFFIFISIIITTLFVLGQSQCSQSCLICVNNTSCTTCISQNNLVLVNSSLGCMPCPSKCQKCSNENDSTKCTSCATGYYEDPTNYSCMACQVSNCKRCNKYVPTECQQCENEYFLQESTSTCRFCLQQYQNSKTCRQNFILSCQQGYFPLNGQSCSKCSQNLSCKFCSSSMICSQCYEGFYLSTGYKCLQCNSTCKSCSNGVNCTTCAKGYRLNTMQKCQLCSTTNCAVCTILDVCQECQSNYYLNTQNKTCMVLQSKNYVQGCLKYASNFNFLITSVYAQTAILCRGCKNGTYLNVLTNSCHNCSLLCDQCNGTYRTSKCMACDQNFGRMIDQSNGICAPKIYTSSNQKITYINNRNNLNLYIRQGTSFSYQQNLLRCPGGQFSSSISINLNDTIGYQYQVSTKLLIQTQTLSSYNIFVSVNQIDNYQFTITNATSIETCNSIKIVQFSFKFTVVSFSSSNQTLIYFKKPNVLTFKSNVSDVLIDVRELIIAFKQCHSSCALCSVYEKCTSCKNDTYFLQQEKCVSVCDPHYYQDLIRKQCVLACPKGTYPKVIGILWTCQPCNSTCSSCTDLFTCTSCIQGSYLHLSQCLASCPQKYFKNSIFNKCQKCTTPCSQCVSTKQCLSCRIGFYYQNNRTCLIECPTGFYGNMQTMKCDPCKSPCYECISLTDCKSCTAESGLSFFDSKCLQKCPSAHYAKKDNPSNRLSCEYCQFPCSECIQSQKKCTACIEGFLLSSNNSCFTSCPDGYFNSVTYMKCIACQNPCKNCKNSQTLCTSCLPGFLFNSQQKTCYSNCSEGYYPDSQLVTCLKCPDECKSCTNKLICNSCMQGFYLQSGKCVQKCQDGFFEFINDNNQPVCFECSKQCSTCFGQSGYCLSCRQNHFLQDNNTCSSLCEQNQLNPGCIPCQYPCYSCQSRVQSCTSCVSNYYLSQQTHQCMTSCYVGFYKHIQKGFGYCKKCRFPCTNCLNENICYSCALTNLTKYYLQTVSANVRICVVNCSLYEYQDQIEMICMPCVQPCLTCLNFTYCLTCQTGILVNGSCVSKIDGCPIGNYQSQSEKTLADGTKINYTQCSACPLHCSSCKSNTICTGCVQDFYLYETKCVDFCPSGTSPVKQLRKCIYCQYPCAQCQGISTNCTKCARISLESPNVFCSQNRKVNNSCIKYYLMNGQCLSQCPLTSFPNVEKCSSCTSPCSTCTSQTQCTSCVINYFMLENKCYQKCPDTFYSSQITNQCQSCIYPCSNCLSPTQCSSCIDGLLFQQQCTDRCNVGFFEIESSENGRYCEKCNQKCLACIDSKDNCLQCAFSAIYEGLCYQKCPNGYYTAHKQSEYLIKTTISYCQKCPEQCLTCTNQTICQSCSYPYFLLENKCIKACPPNYMERTTTFQFNSSDNYIVSYCSKCVQPCYSCFLEETQCQTCIKGYYMYQKQCLLECPSGTFLNKLTQSCKQCPFPCKYCHQVDNQVLCVQCYTGYFVLSGLCVDKCVGRFISDDSKRCVDDCGNGYEVYHILTKVNFCTSSCQLPYLKSANEKKCLIQCPQEQYANSEYACVNYQASVQHLIPKLKTHMYVNSKGFLILYIQFEKSVLFTNSVSMDQVIQITENQFGEDINRRLLSSGIQSLKGSQISFKISFISQNILMIGLYPFKSISSASFIQLKFKQNSHLYIIDKVSKIPLQSSIFNTYLDSIHSYQVYDYKLLVNNRFFYIGEIIIDFLLILGLIMLVFNRYAKIYNILIFLQSVFMLSCLDINLPPNLYRFLQGFKYSHFYQIGNWIDSLSQNHRYSDFSNKNFNRIESIFSDVSFLRISGHIVCLYFVLIGLALLIYLSKYLPEFQITYLKQLVTKINQKSKHIKWSHTTDVFISTFMLITASFFFQTIDYSGSKTQQSIGIAVSWVFFLLLTSYCIYFCYKSCKMYLVSQKQPQKFVKKQYLYREDYISFFEGISTTQNCYKNYLLVIKLILYGALTGLLWNYPNFCLSIWITMEIIFSVIYVCKKPYSDDIQNLLYCISGILYSIAMLLMIALNRQSMYLNTNQINFSSENNLNLQKKILIGYFIIVLVLICTFIFIIEMMISIMRGNLKRQKLDGEEEEYNEVKQSSPNNLNIEDPVPQKISVQEKKQFVGYSFTSVDKNLEQKHNFTIKEE